VVGVDAVARAAPDGYTLLLAVATSLSTNPHFVQSATYKPTDFAPVGFISKTPVILLAHPSVPVKSVAELVTFMKQNPGKLRTGTTGPGAFSHLCALMFGAAAQVQIDDVPYRGESPALTALLGNEVQLYFASLPAAMPHIQDGRVTPLAVTSDIRSPALPEIPNFVDAGFPGVVANAWFGIVAPSGTAAPIVQRLHKEVVKAVSSIDTRDRLRAEGAMPQAMTTDEFAQFMTTEYRRWGPILTPLRTQLNQ
jgi:tripartite-type tricarboxylate transporter receptor subunit TctC